MAMRDTLVCETLDIGSIIAYGTPRRRVVTLRGDLIEMSGTMSGGGKPRSGGMSNGQASEFYSEDYLRNLKD